MVDDSETQEEDEAISREETSENFEIQEEEYEEPLENIIEDAPTSNRQRQKQQTSPWLEAEEIPQTTQNLETGLQDVQTTNQINPNQLEIENEPQYTSSTYQNEIQTQKQIKAPQPENLANPVSSPNLLQPQFNQAKRLLQPQNQTQQTIIREDNKKYQSNFEQQEKDRRRF